jgi:hypothetical protein
VNGSRPPKEAATAGLRANIAALEEELLKPEIFDRQLFFARTKMVKTLFIQNPPETRGEETNEQLAKAKMSSTENSLNKRKKTRLPK